MQHIKVTFVTSEEAEREMLIAILSGNGYDGFEETDEELFAYIDESAFDELVVKSVAEPVGASYRTEVIPVQNWNALWESNFQPVVVEDLCTIRAHFHEIEITTPYEIVITPKMSFGTGHHATTRMMMLLMKELDFTGKSVFDFGTGTGVLAILAEKLGAGAILAIDNDEWPVTNAIENTERNQCSRVTVQRASLEDIQDLQADIVLANINRSVLLLFMGRLYEITASSGHLLLSGILAEDREIMLKTAAAAGFDYTNSLEQSGWMALHFVKCN